MGREWPVAIIARHAGFRCPLGHLNRDIQLFVKDRCRIFDVDILRNRKGRSHAQIFDGRSCDKAAFVFWRDKADVIGQPIIADVLLDGCQTLGGDFYKAGHAGHCNVAVDLRADC